MRSVFQAMVKPSTFMNENRWRLDQHWVATHSCNMGKHLEHVWSTHFTSGWTWWNNGALVNIKIAAGWSSAPIQEHWYEQLWKYEKIIGFDMFWPIRKSVLKQQFQLSCVKRNISWVLPSGTGKSKIAPWSSIIALEMEFFLARRMDYKSCTKRMVARCWKPMNNGYPLVMTNIAIENDHRNSEFSH